MNEMFKPNLPAVPAELPEDDFFLVPGMAVEIHGKLMVAANRVKKPAPGFAFEDPAVKGVLHVIRLDELKQMYRAGQLVFRPSGFEKLPEEKRANLRRALDDFDDDLRAEIRRRMSYCELVDRLGPLETRSAKTMQPKLDELARHLGDSGSHSWYTVREWHANWNLAGADPRVLAPNHHLKGNRRSKLPPHIDEALDAAVDLWLDRGRPSIVWVWHKVIEVAIEKAGGVDQAFDGINKLPYYEALRQRCYKVDRATKLYCRYGPAAARQAITPVGAGVDVRFPLEHVEGDFMYMPLFVVDDGPIPVPLGTPFVMALFDVYSGIPIGFDIGFDPPSYLSAARCLRHAIAPKDLSEFPNDEYGAPIIHNSYPVSGVPFQLFLDNDRAFHAASFEQSCEALGCHVNFVPPGQPWKKGHVERFWLTVQNTFFGGAAGKVFKPHERPEGYDPTQHAVVTLSALKLQLTKAIVDYHILEIDELTGKRRIDLWLEGMEKRRPRALPDWASLTALVGAYATRVADRRGIRIFGLRYNSPELAAYRNMFHENPTVEIRYDPQDLGEIELVDRERRINFKIRCTRFDYASGLSEYQHKVIRAYVAGDNPQRRIHIKQLLRARAELYALAKKMLGTKESRRGRLRVAQFLGVGRNLLDEMARRPFDAVKSASPLALGASTTGTAPADDDLANADPVADEEDDRRAADDEAASLRDRKASRDRSPESDASEKSDEEIPGQAGGFDAPDENTNTARPAHGGRGRRPNPPKVSYD